MWRCYADSNIESLWLAIMRGSRGGTEGWSYLENHTVIGLGFLNNTGLDPLENHKAAKPAFNVGPLSARQRNTI